LISHILTEKQVIRDTKRRNRIGLTGASYTEGISVEIAGSCSSRLKRAVIEHVFKVLRLERFLEINVLLPLLC
jgi:hypothetical protein